MSAKITPEQLAELVAERIDLDALADKLAVELARRSEADEWITASEAARATAMRPGGGATTPTSSAP